MTEGTKHIVESLERANIATATKQKPRQTEKSSRMCRVEKRLGCFDGNQGVGRFLHVDVCLGQSGPPLQLWERRGQASGSQEPLGQWTKSSLNWLIWFACRVTACLLYSNPASWSTLLGFSSHPSSLFFLLPFCLHVSSFFFSFHWTGLYCSFWMYMPNLETNIREGLLQLQVLLIINLSPVSPNCICDRFWLKQLF